MTAVAVTAPLSEDVSFHKAQPAFSGKPLQALIHRVRDTVEVVRHNSSGAIGLRLRGSSAADCAVTGVLPPLYPEWLGDRSFLEVHKTRFPYVVGEMAAGIAPAGMVIAAARAGFLGFFGAAGLALDRVERGISEIDEALKVSGSSWGSNLIHTPYQPDMEDAVADLYIRKDVRRISASAFMSLTPSVARVAASGLHVDAQGRVHRRRFIFAKISRPETASQFLSPPPAAMLDSLASKGMITREEARLASRVPVAEDITVEADSGGHTDNRPLVCLLPVILDLRDRIAAKSNYARPIRVGAAGGIGAPASVAAAFSLGAAYVLTGSINQSAVEAGTSQAVKAMLAKAEISDVMMAPAADMFELGVKVQVLKRGAMFPVRAAQLHKVYSEFSSLDAIPADLRGQLERDVFLASFDDIWADCVRFWQLRDPGQIAKAAKDQRHRMALVFRWYLGNASRWATGGDAARQLDYQIWCGPAMGAFNAWVSDSFLADPANRDVVQIGLNLLEGAAVITRAHQARTYGVAVPSSAFSYRPRLLS
ncbi:MAG: PfaD family polyunsaturated fatty acid/polyketide biosynthesis protein [Bryobacteraceae bacterium]|jgi:trans-AT polyketide synthase/acyltransferase/oxidoreductase domain-containing protein